MSTAFFRVLETDDKASALRDLVQGKHLEKANRFEVDTASFSAIPTSPFAYWVSESLRRMFVKLPAIQSGGRNLSFGASTKDDFRFVRSSLEIPPREVGGSRDETETRPWVPLAKGGKFSPYYSDVHLLVNWDKDGHSLKADISEYRGSRGWGYQWSAALNGHAHYFRPGLTWSRRTNGLSLRVLPAGCIFADKGPGAFVEGDNEEELLALAALTNSSIFAMLVSLQVARTELAQSFEVGIIQQTPVPPLNEANRVTLASLAKKNWSLMRRLDLHDETSHAFTLPGLLLVSGETLADRQNAFAARTHEIEIDIARIQNTIDMHCMDLYGVNKFDRVAVAQQFGSKSYEKLQVQTEPTAVETGDDESPGNRNQDEKSLAVGLASWAVGVSFGRFDLRLAVAGHPLPLEPPPFATLPPCSPGMLRDENGLPPAVIPTEYPVQYPKNGILVEDFGHPSDVVAAVRTIFDLVFENGSEQWWSEISASLAEKSRDVRDWFAFEYFEQHIKSHSKSRRKAPIVWQLAVPSCRYSVWLYAHRLGRDTLIQVQNDFVVPKLAHEERLLADLLLRSAGAPSSSDRREIEEKQKFVGELREFAEEVKRVAPLWNPSLADGIVLAMAPLWKLVPHNRSWQRELKGKWDELVDGKHDWSHLAMHLWPERVVPKCAEDRSIAIAHGLEENFWFESEDGKWEPYKKPKRSIAALVQERTVSAVKAALKSLVEVSHSAVSTKRTRKSKAA